MTHLTATEREMDSRGASTLVNTLMDHEENIHKEIAFWNQSINNQFSLMEESDMYFAHNIRKWYRQTREIHEVRDSRWEVRVPREQELIQKFKEDRNYPVKNIAEMAVRDVLEAYFRKKGIKVKVFITSDYDDIFSKTDFIVELEKDGIVTPISVDMAVSRDVAYLRNKFSPFLTECREYNYKNYRKERGMSRVVLAIPPERMATFLSEYMDQVSSGNFPTSLEAYEMFLGQKRGI